MWNLQNISLFWSLFLNFYLVFCEDSNGLSTVESGPKSIEVREGWPQLLLTLKESQKYYHVIWFDPDTKSEHDIPSIGGHESLHYSHPVTTGSAVSDLVCIEVWTFFCKRLHAPNRVEVGPWDKLAAADDPDQRLRRTLHLEVNPYEGNQVMYLEPIRQAIWLYYPLKNQALLISTFDGENIINFKVDWVHALLFVTNGSVISAYSFEPTGLEPRYQILTSTTYLSNDPVGRFLYWTDDAGSIFKRHYDWGGVSKVADKACVALPAGMEDMRIRPLYFENGTAVCIEKIGDSLKLTRFGGNRTVEVRTLSRNSGSIPPGNLKHYSIFTNTSLDPVRSKILEVCDRCSHFCVPVNSSMKYQCACAYGFNLADEWRCENLTVLATVAEINRTAFKGAPEGATHVLQLIYFMDGSKPVWTYAFESSRFHIVPSEDAGWLCLHFSANNSLECFSPFEDRKLEKLLWASSPGDVIVKVTRGETFGTSKIFLVSSQLCFQVFQTVDNVTYTLYCDPKINPHNLYIDEFNWRLFLGTDEGLKLVLLPNQTESTISRCKSIRTNGNTPGSEQENQMVFDPTNESLYFFPNKGNILFKANLKNLAKYQKVQIGYKGTQNNAMLYRQNLLYLDGQDRIRIISADHLAGAQFLHDFPDGELRGLQFTMVDYPSKTSNKTSIVQANPPLCSASSALGTEERQDCWCPPLMFNNDFGCRPIELLLGVVKRDSSTAFSVHSNKLGSSKRETVDGVPSTFRFGELFSHEPHLQRICVLALRSVTCTTYGSNAKIQWILETSIGLHFVEKVGSSSTDLYWISGEATKSVNRMCLNVGFPEIGSWMRYSCFPEDANLQYPHFIEDSGTLIWSKTSKGTCEIRSFKIIDDGNVVSLFRVPGTCFGVEVGFEVSGTKVFVLTSKGLYGYLNGSSVVLVSQLKVSKPKAFEFFNNFVFLTIKTQVHSNVSVVGPLNNGTSKPLQLLPVFTSEADEDIVDISFKNPKNHQKTLSSSLCQTAFCRFLCQVQSDEPVCMCQVRGANATVFGIQFERCRPSADEPFDTSTVTSTTFLWWPIPVSVLMLIVFASAMSAIFWRKFRKQDAMFRSAIYTFVKGNDSQIQHATTESERALHLPFTAIIPPDELEVSQGKKLGEGDFGVVFQGTYNDHQVAVKTVKNNNDTQLIQDFLKELKIMAYVGTHENIVQFLGAEISEIEKGLVRVVLELCTRGCLLSTLQGYDSIETECEYIEVAGEAPELQVQKLVPEVLPSLNNVIQSQYQSWPICVANPCKSNKVSLNQLCKWAFEIASAMDYLERKNVVHGDLAARNILVCDDLTAKISDFGFSKNMYQSKIYRKKKGCPLPWRWASPETMSRLEFSFKADVWSYGVTVWEVFSLGAVPFPDQDWNKAFVTGLKEGLRLPQPEQMPFEIYQEILLPCWNHAPGDRPSFGSLVNLWSRQSM